MTRGAQDTESVSILGYNQLISRDSTWGSGSAVSVLIFICVLDHRVRRSCGVLGVRMARGKAWDLADAARHEGIRASGASAIVLVLIFALVPLRLDHLDVAEDARDGHATAGSSPADWTFDNYKILFEGGFDNSPFMHPLINSIAIALISTVIAIVLAAFAAYAIARLDFPGKTVILAGALAIAMFPAISIVGPLFDMWRALGLYDTYLGADHPLPDLRAAAGDLHPGRPSSGRSPGISSRRPRSTARRRCRRSAR